jgi:hypothetical protein
LREKGLSKQQASSLFKVLVNDEYVQLDTDSKLHRKFGSFYKLTERGRTMMRATGAKSVQRETAKRVLDESWAGSTSSMRVRAL